MTACQPMTRDIETVRTGEIAFKDKTLVSEIKKTPHRDVDPSILGVDHGTDGSPSWPPVDFVN